MVVVVRDISILAYCACRRTHNTEVFVVEKTLLNDPRIVRSTESVVQSTGDAHGVAHSSASMCTKVGGINDLFPTVRHFVVPKRPFMKGGCSVQHSFVFMFVQLKVAVGRDPYNTCKAFH